MHLTSGSGARIHLVGLSVCGCLAAPPALPELGSDGAETVSSATSADPTSADTTSSGGETSMLPTTTSSVTSSGDESETGQASCNGTCLVDIVFVIDNSETMALEQLRLAKTMTQLERDMVELGVDAQVMFTTTDFGNPLCTAFQPQGYDPARGAPVATACVDRLEWFTGLGASPEVANPTCTDVCADAVVPEEDPFVAIGPAGTNVPGDRVADVDGDGIPDAPAGQALACLAPMGINGCNYESPLETMLQALAPSAEWNLGARPFLRPDAILAIVILTDEADCSVLDYDILQDEAYQEVDPQSGNPTPSSAICWNAGTECSGPDAMGVYDDCQPGDAGLQPVERYTNYLVDELRDNQGKEVVMLGIVGVPPVTGHAGSLPGTPTSGGVHNLVIHDWRDGEYPVGDILPEEFADGVTAAEKNFELGIGPGCTEQDQDGWFTQAIPPVRMRHVCDALNLSDELADQRCCLESVCDRDYVPALGCLRGLIENVLP